MCSNFTTGTPGKGRKTNKDLICSLADDDIVIRIVSFLDLKEAAKTSTLSKRWRYVWANLPDCYDFDASETQWSRLESCDNQQFETKLRGFVRYITKVVRSSPAQNINRFRVRVPLDFKYKDDLQRWMNFAMGRGVKELELNLCGGAYKGEYQRGKSPVYLGPFGCYEQSPSAKTLVTLSLIALHINGVFLDSVLLNLPNLERLTMRYLDLSLHNNIRVIGSSLKLRYLEMSGCKGLKALEISAGNLVSFVCSDLKEDLKFLSVPLLTEVSFSGMYAVRLIHNFQTISGFSSRLTKLALTSIVENDRICRSPVKFPRFRKLKQLELQTVVDSHMSLPFLSNFIEACPVLHEFKLQCKWRSHTGKGFDGRPVGNVNGFDTVSQKIHRHLITFEMVGFLGCKVDIELVLYLAQFAILLGKIVLHPLLEEDYCGQSKEESSRKQAKLLGDQIPARVQLEVL